MGWGVFRISYIPPITIFHKPEIFSAKYTHGQKTKCDDDSNYITRPYDYVALNSYLSLSNTHHLGVFLVLSSDAMATGRFLDVVWIDLIVT